MANVRTFCGFDLGLQSTSYFLDTTTEISAKKGTLIWTHRIGELWEQIQCLPVPDYVAAIDGLRKRCKLCRTAWGSRALCSIVKVLLPKMRGGEYMASAKQYHTLTVVRIWREKDANVTATLTRRYPFGTSTAVSEMCAGRDRSKPTSESEPRENSHTREKESTHKEYRQSTKNIKPVQSMADTTQGDAKRPTGAASRVDADITRQTHLHQPRPGGVHKAGRTG